MQTPLHVSHCAVVVFTTSKNGVPDSFVILTCCVRRKSMLVAVVVEPLYLGSIRKQIPGKMT